jgi:hypothetical protein
MQQGGSDPVCGSCPFPGTGYCDFYARGGGKRGGGCGCGMRTQGGGSKATTSQGGGGCGCSAGLLKGGTRKRKGGYRASKRNLKYLKKWKRGESIGFTMTSSLKAKGLIPRTSKTMKGKRVVSRKYK